MVATWVLWLFLVGVATGVVVALVVVVRLPRRDDDVTAAERPTEAAWISDVVERRGGIAPVLLVEEVLDLHGAYLREARPPVPPSAVMSGFDAAGSAAPGFAPADYAPAGYAPIGYPPPGYAPPGYAAPGVGPAGSAPPGQAPRMPPPDATNPPTMPPTRR